MGNNALSTKRSKHIDIQFHFTKEKVQSNEIELKYCPTNLMIADGLTKILGKIKFLTFRNLINVNDFTNMF